MRSKVWYGVLFRMGTFSLVSEGNSVGAGEADILARIIVALREGGIGALGVAWILLFVVAFIISLIFMYIFSKYHNQVVRHLTDEISRIASERDKWQNYVFEGKLKSSKDEFYEKVPGDEKKTNPPSNLKGEQKRKQR